MADEHDQTTAAEFESLEASASARRLQLRETSQRYWLRWIAVGVGLAIIRLMVIVLLYALWTYHSDAGTETNPVLAVTLVIAPIVSMTVITITLFIAAFRGFKQGDGETLSDTTSTGALAGGVVN